MLNAVALFIPVFLLIVFLEWYVSYKKHDNKYSTGNTTMNLTIGAIDQICSLFYFALLFVVMEYVYNHLRIISISNIWYQWIGGYIAVDFLSYWYHRFSHRVNILWAGHVTHHSSELFNLSNGFRTSVFQGINRIIFWSFLPLFGFAPIVLVIILKVSGVYDFLQHTEYVPKLKFFGKIFITPSTHRVHHGKNDIYIDKNYGSTFVFWDKMFGTYQDETEVVKYGIKSNYVDNNPLTAIGHHYQYLWRSMKVSPLWSDKIKILFMPPEWKPPIPIISKSSIQEKGILITQLLMQYAYFQLFFSIIGIITVLVYKDFLSRWEIILCSVFAVMAMVNVTMIFNRNYSVNFEKQELIRLTCALLFACFTLFLYSNIYLWSIIIFLLVSLVLILRTGVHLYKFN